MRRSSLFLPEFVFFYFAFFAFASPVFTQSVVLEAQTNALQNAITGAWSADIGNTRVKFKLDDSGRYNIDGVSGTHRVQDNSIDLSDSSGVTTRFNIVFATKDSFTLSGGDLPQPLKFNRIQETTGALRTYLKTSPTAIRGKIISIFMIVVITFVSRMILALIKIVSGFLIFSERGFLKYLYKDNKSRRRTIHSLTLDIFKYIIYFTAFGFILSEIGVNYTTYLASLSVIGLAIGFGSQGLVQDVVTGFFLIFEGQFNVGDMIEISGNTGLVRDMGLRMTKLQNYQGQIIFIPNRNIAIAGKFAAGALEGYIDVSLSSNESYRSLKPLLRTLLAALFRQFDNVFLASSHIEPVLALKTGEYYLRVHVCIWPGQAWIIDQQLIPRLRELLSRENITVPSDRITVFYHMRQEQQVSSISDRLRTFRIQRRGRTSRKRKRSRSLDEATITDSRSDSPQ